ncbi:MAG: hypothetical protein QF886_03710, partial [Planctomycetota bacterium]|nr:hypothetical protein [Planctomycetota bacterium]
MSCALRSETIAPNPRILRLEKNRWIKLHELKPDASGRFMRQAHGGSCFDSKRCKLVLFGSNTHGKDWMNSPRIYDPVKNEWSQTYPDDPQSTYQVSGEGIPVAGTKADHPWAMHTFGAVLYDSARDEMVIASHPGHMVPGRFTDSMKSLWGDIKRHPTWVFNFEKSEWSALPCKSTSFFPY